MTTSKESMAAWYQQVRDFLSELSVAEEDGNEHGAVQARKALLATLRTAKWDRERREYVPAWILPDGDVACYGDAEGRALKAWLALDQVDGGSR